MIHPTKLATLLIFTDVASKIPALYKSFSTASTEKIVVLLEIVVSFSCKHAGKTFSSSDAPGVLEN